MKVVHLPDFFNWNRVKLRYCDGASFSGEGYNEVRTHFYPLQLYIYQLRLSFNGCLKEMCYDFRHQSFTFEGKRYG